MNISHYKQMNVELIGKDHVRGNLPCQDKTAYYQKNGVRVIALADGAGSKKDSHLGADIATNTVCKLLIDKFDEYFTLLEDEPSRKSNLGKIIVKEVYQNLNNLVTENKAISIIEMSSTLLFVAMKGDRYIQGHIGDGLIGELLNGETGLEVRVRSYPENNGAPNITFFITDSDANDNFRITSGFIGSHIKGFVLMSDGPEEVLYDLENKTLNPYIKNLFTMYKGTQKDSYSETLLRFLDEQVSKYSYDDLSINFLYIENESIDYYKSLGQDYLAYLDMKISNGADVIRKSGYSYMIEDSFYVHKSSRSKMFVEGLIRGNFQK